MAKVSAMMRPDLEASSASPSRLTKLASGALASVGIAGICFVDVISGPDFGMSLFYLVPVAATGWWAGRTTTVLVALLAAIAWLLADALVRPASNWPVSSWNGATRLVMYCAIGLFTAVMKRDRVLMSRLFAAETALARTDGLTGLSNGRAFRLALDERIPTGRAERGDCLLYLDLDNFKQVNDRFGHAAGDAVLSEVGALLRTSIRDGDIAARMGGDEFAVLLRNVAESEVPELGQRIVAAISRLAERYPGTGLGASVGAIVSRAPLSAEEFLKLADGSMYEAKRAGKGRVEVQILPLSTNHR